MQRVLLELEDHLGDLEGLVAVVGHLEERGLARPVERVAELLASLANLVVEVVHPLVEEAEAARPQEVVEVEALPKVMTEDQIPYHQVVVDHQQM